MDDNNDRIDYVNAVKKIENFISGDYNNLEEQLERAHKEIARLRAAQSKGKSAKMRGAKAFDGDSDDENDDEEKHDARLVMAATTATTVTTRPMCTIKD